MEKTGLSQANGLETLLKNYADILWSYHPSTGCLLPDSEAAARYGLSASYPGGVKELLLSGLLHEDSAASLQQMLEQLSRKEGSLSASLLARLAPESGPEYRWYNAVFSSCRAMGCGCQVDYSCQADAAGQTGSPLQIVGFFKDIDCEMRRQLQLQRLAELDRSTQVYNAQAARELITRTLQLQPPCCRNAMIVFDIDNFKQLNDTYGHPTGDRVLQHFAEILCTVCRKSDTVFRIGGDEFGLFLYHTGEDSLLERICSDIQLRLSGSGSLLPCASVSIGAAVGCKAAPTYQDYYLAADKAMYQAKRSKKGSFSICHFGDSKDVNIS